jgi:cellobiose phosphorylase
MEFGYFDDARREYVITDPRTPVKWINYIGSLAFGGFVDHTGGALICKGDPALNRITKYISQMPASDFKGETLYLRRRTPDGYRVFSPYFVPCLAAYESYRCHVGLGYTRIRSIMEEIETDVNIFVPPEPQAGGRELRLVRVTNRSGQPVTLDAVPVVEYTHFDALKQLTNADWVPQTMQSRAVTMDGEHTILLQYAFMKRDTALNFFTASLPASSFETDRKNFLGANEYGTWANPLSLQAAELPCSEASRGDNIAALLVPLGTLQPGESRQFVTQLGQEASLEAALPGIDQYNRLNKVEAALADLARFWGAYLEKQQVLTPDPALNSMLNIHNPRQCHATLNWSRYLSLYQLGYGSRGIGFRDSSQDVMGVLASAPAEAKALLRKLLSVQKPDGSAMHQFNPLTMIAEVGDSAERPDRPHYYSDDHLWAVQAVCAYLKETGDLEFLKEEIPYYTKNTRGEQVGAVDRGSVFDHLCRGLAFTRSDGGAHGLPHLGFADWNDTLNLPAGAESLLTACLYARGLGEMVELCTFLRDGEHARQFSAWYEDVKAAFNRHGWDGAWFASYFDADGTPLGSQKNEAGQIYNYGQSWPVISGLCSPERGRLALQAAYERLNTRCGVKLSAPGFNGFDPARGGITTYPPGAKENGGIFLHTNPWLVIAETLQGNGERAYAYYAQINPAAKNDRIEEYECEPYVYAQNILADEHPRFGLGRNSWLSGTASWMYQAGTQYILGVRPGYNGLLVDPCIPAAWGGFSVQRTVRGARYAIEVRNPRHVNKGVVKTEVDGKELPGNIIPYFADGQTHTVTITMQ